MADEQRAASLSPNRAAVEMPASDEAAAAAAAALKAESMEVAAASSSATTNFRWPDYPRSMTSTLRSLKEEEDFVDVTLACNSRQFTAHKVILSACSPYFRQLLKSNPCQHPIVILRDVSERDMRNLLKFMYTGEVRVSEDDLKDFLRTAETLQIRGLMEGDAAAADETRMKPSSEEEDVDRRRGSLEHNGFDPFGPTSAKRFRVNGPLEGDNNRKSSPVIQSSSSPRSFEDSRGHWGGNTGGAASRASSRGNEDNNNGNNAASGGKDSLLSQALEKHGSAAAMLRSAGIGELGVNAMGGDDESASDTASDRPESLLDSSGATSSDQLHRPQISTSSSPGNPGGQSGSPGGSNPLFPPGLEALYRQAGFPSAFLGLAAGASGASSPAAPASSVSGITTPTPPHQGGLQSHSGNPNFSFSSDVTGKLDMMRVRATDPRPCPKCGKIYRSAHTLRTHMEDKHTVCPGYRCVLCGTVAKSRNSLHSHMSRQHRGISTKELPVVPMPAPFDADLAARLLNKAGVKVTSRELAARASPTAPRRTDLPKLDSNLSIMHTQQFPLPPTLPGSSGGGGGGERSRGPSSAALLHERMKNNSDELEDLRRQASPFGGSNGGSTLSPRSTPGSIGRLGGPAGALGLLNPKDFSALAAGMTPPSTAASSAPGMGSALLDTYLSMIAAAGGDTNAMAAALNFQNSASRAAAFAAAAAAAGGAPGGPPGLTSPPLGIPPTNGDNEAKNDDDDEGELGSDAENDDVMSEGEDQRDHRDVDKPQAMETGGGGQDPAGAAANNAVAAAE